MFSTMKIIVWLVSGALGMGYIIYGKKQSSLVFMLSGIALGVYPYLFSNIIVLIIIGVVLAVVPFVIKD
jgi:hypothetical protein